LEKAKVTLIKVPLKGYFDDETGVMIDQKDTKTAIEKANTID
jgi:hypothetical protein